MIRLLLALTLLFNSCLAWGQFQASGNFTSSTLDAGWTLGGAAALTAPTIDANGNGWLRLTGNTNDTQGNALYTGGSFSALTGLNITFSYVSWGGGSPGADGISIFLYDATQNMSGSLPGGGLGFCKGAGAYLGIALDEYGNFSNGGDRCTGGGGPGRVQQTLSIRGPTASNNPFITNTAVPGGIDSPTATIRPALNQVVLSLVPKTAGVGYTLNVSFRNGPTAPLTPLLSNVNFPYAAPSALSVGIAASTGGSKNIHEVQNLSVGGNAPQQPAVSKSFNPSSMTVPGTSALVLTMNSANNTATTLTAKFTDNLPAGVTIAATPVLGGSCPGTSNAAAGGSTVTYALGAVIPAVGCTVVVNVVSTVVGTYTNLIAPGALQTVAGSNALPATATLVVRPVVPPTVSKSFTPTTTTTLAGGTSTLLLTLGNQNTRAGALSSPFTDNLPTNLRIATPPMLAGSCPTASVTANAGSSTISYANGASLPVGGCTISVSVSSTVTGTFTNVIPIAALATDLGSNTAGATASLVVTPAALLSVTKTDGQTTVIAGATTTYTLVITNGGPSDVANATVADTPGAGLSCSASSVSCAPSGLAQCPTTFTNLFGAGSVIPQLPNGTFLTIKVPCQITATGT